MPLHSARTRSEARAHHETLEFVWSGRGFVDFASHRVYAPFIGAMRWVPSADEETRVVRSFPRMWHIVVACTGILVFGRAIVQWLALPSSTNDWLFPGLIVTFFVVRFLRWRALTAPWPTIEPQAASRTRIALAGLGTIRLGWRIWYGALSAMMALWLIWAISASVQTSPHAILAVALICVLLFPTLRMGYWCWLSIKNLPVRTAQ